MVQHLNPNVSDTSDLRMSFVGRYRLAVVSEVINYQTFWSCRWRNQSWMTVIHLRCGAIHFIQTNLPVCWKSFSTGLIRNQIDHNRKFCKPELLPHLLDGIPVIESDKGFVWTIIDLYQLQPKEKLEIDNWCNDATTERICLEQKEELCRMWWFNFRWYFSHSHLLYGLHLYVDSSLLSCPSLFATSCCVGGILSGLFLGIQQNLDPKCFSVFSGLVGAEVGTCVSGIEPDLFKFIFEDDAHGYQQPQLRLDGWQVKSFIHKLINDITGHIDELPWRMCTASTMTWNPQERNDLKR